MSLIRMALSALASGVDGYHNDGVYDDRTIRGMLAAACPDVAAPTHG